ncbi:MAG: right-handed parallel beta-helix repeat-containing protein, partial [Dermatophilus congolensis]|nr:right-handed parallel beta-helix repeat-containing protein [Dermatophilus congolensis]
QTGQTGVWRMPGYSIRLDTSPTFTRGAPDNTEPGWRFVDPEFPLAADPQQIWLGGSALTQVGSIAEVKPGTFYVDEAEQALYVGDDPGGKRPLSAGAITKALLVTGPGAQVEGIGVRRHVPSLPDFGAITLDGPGAVLRDVLVTGSSTIGVSVQTHDVTLERVTLRESGMLGLHAHRADDLRLLDVVATGNNTQRFNAAPASAGAKITLSRGLYVRGGSYSGNRGNGLWLDESVVDSDVIGVDATDNLVHGIQVELCAGVDVLRAVAARNGDAGISVQNSDHVRIWNATTVANRRQVMFVQDGRRPSDPGADTRLLTGSNGSPTWVIGSSELVNSVLSNATGQFGVDSGPGSGGAAAREQVRSDADTLFAVEDYTKTLDAGSLDIRLRGNLYLPDPRGGRPWTHVWSRTGDNPAVFASLAAFTKATGQDTGSVQGASRPGLAAQFSWRGTVGAGRPVPPSP